VKESGAKFSDRPPKRGNSRPPDLSQMDVLLQRCGIRLSAAQLNQLWRYHQLLRRHDEALNLTRIRNFENMVVKLYADSMLPARHAALPSPLLDLGTGPGMPGIPLKIFRPDLHILLAESRQHRSEFLNAAVADLDLAGLEVVGRGIAPDYDRPVAGVITRAVEPISDTLERVAGCLQKDGMVIFMKGPRCDEEIEKATQLFAHSYELGEDISYRIPHTPHQRRLVCYRRQTAPVRAAEAHQAISPHHIRVLESEHNAIFKDLKKLLSGRGIKKQGRTLVCGTRLVAEVLQRSPERCLAWISSTDRQAPPDKAPSRLEWFQLAPDLFRQLDPFGTRSPLILFEVPALSPWQPTDPLAPGCSLLVPFQDPENVGAVIRCAAAFAVQRIILLSESANPFHPKAIRTSAGTVFSVNLLQGPSLESLPPDLPVIALAASGRPLTRTVFPDSFCLLAGMEGPGLPPRWQADAVAIPMATEVESLNAAVAAGIALYEWRQGFSG
jgi:16S rRNA (guanine(527)-N(7))-methyltransferase RsmG